MALVRGVEVRASGVFAGWPPERIIDGQLETSWFASQGQAANLGMPPWVEVVLPEAAVVTGLKVFGNRESPDGFDILQAQVEFFNFEGTLLHAELLPLPVDDFSDIDLELAAPVKGVRRVRLNSVLDQGSSPGFAEIEIIGNFKVTQAVNLAMNQAAAISASSEFSGYPAGRAVDGNSDTSWFAENGDAANLGAEPWLEIALPGPSMVTEIVIRGNREFPSGFDIFAGRLELFGEGDTLIFMEAVEFPDDLRDLELVLANPLLDVRRARFTSTQDESAAPGLAEFQIWGHDQSQVEWTGAQDEDWFNPLNWNLGFVPTLANEVTLSQQTAIVSTDSLYRSLVLDGARISGTLRPGTTLTWRSGHVAFPLNIGPNDRLELIGDGDKLLGADLNNQGVVVWSGGGNLAFFASGGQAHFNNHGLLDIRSDVSLALGSAGTYALQNSGTILKSAASPADTGTFFDTFEAIPFHNTGLIRVEQGRFHQRGNFRNSGTVEVAAGAAFVMSDGIYTLEEFGIFRGDGYYGVSHGTVLGEINSANFQIQSITGGEVRITGTARLVESGAILASMTTVAPEGMLILDGTIQNTIGNDIINQGTVLWNNGTFAFHAFGGRAHFDNQGLLEIRSDGVLAQGSEGDYNLINSGTILKSAASPADTGTFFDTFEAIPFHNTGLIRVEQGRFNQRGNFRNSGTVEVAAGAAFVMSDGIYTLEEFGIFRGDGYYGVSYGTVQGVVNSDRFQINGPVDGAVEVRGTAFFQNGGLSGAWEVGPSGEIVIQDGSMNFQGTLHNEGIIRFEDNSHTVISQGDVAINNLGAIVFGGSVNLGRLTEGTMTLSNTGTLRIANADASVSFSSGQIIEQRGLLQISGGRLALQEPLIQTEGSIVFENGTLETPAGLTLQGGSMTGAGRVLGQLTNESVLRPGPAGGELQVDGDYIQTENGRLELVIAAFAPANHSFPLQISGLAQWNGVVQVDFADGFKGVAGTSFPLVAYANHAGIPSLAGNATMFGAVLRPVENALNLVAPSPLTLNATADGTVHLRFAGTPGKTMILEASTDFAAWTEIQRGNLGILEASDLDARDFPHRFYRIREQP